MSKDVLIRLEDVKKYFEFKDGFATQYVKAVDGITLDIFKGETLGLVGESGCGKSTLGRTILRLYDKAEGTVEYLGQDVWKANSKDMLKLRRDMQIVFQDPLASLNPRKTIYQIIEEPLCFHGYKNKAERKEMVEAIMKAVGLDPAVGNRYPHEFSGGQQQRVGIARALILRPQFIVCDEAVSALDVSVQAQILNLLQKLKEEYQLTYLFISHNLSVIKHVCDRIVVMYLGNVVEIASKEQLFANPCHPYTRALISAIPIPDPDQKRQRILLEGDNPSPVNPPDGCRFHPRCYERSGKETCCCDRPQLVEVEPGHFVACHQYCK